MKPKIFKKGNLIILGLKGDGAKTAELWAAFDTKSQGIVQKIDSPGYEVRFISDDRCECFVGVAVTNRIDAEGFELLELPVTEYASFDVIVAKGYDSENANMDRWLTENMDKYIQARIDGKHYVIECYTERFNEGIVEIWIPLERVCK
ncbi:MAG: GyrI-like domain-containing protein [Ruminiclostridium sp.]|nr:GyrI-like domain-containing protein [Ruminiclostridium sp.]